MQKPSTTFGVYVGGRLWPFQRFQGSLRHEQFPTASYYKLLKEVQVLCVSWVGCLLKQSQGWNKFHGDSNLPPTWLCKMGWGSAQQRNKIMKRAAPLGFTLKPDRSVQPCRSLMLFKLLTSARDQHNCIHH